MYRVLEVTDWIRGQLDYSAGDSITPLKLQKLLYYGQAWSLALNGRPLFDEDFRAWTHGPVLPSVWTRFRRHRWDALPPPNSIPTLKKRDEQLLTNVLDAYGGLTARQLEQLTHVEAPWRDARAGLPQGAHSTARIDKSAMRDFYRKLLAQTDEQESR